MDAISRIVISPTMFLYTLFLLMETLQSVWGAAANCDALCSCGELSNKDHDDDMHRKTSHPAISQSATSQALCGRRAEDKRALAKKSLIQVPRLRKTWIQLAARHFSRRLEAVSSALISSIQHKLVFSRLTAEIDAAVLVLGNCFGIIAGKSSR